MKMSSMIQNLRRPGFVCIDKLGNIFMTEIGVVGVTYLSPFGILVRRCFSVNIFAFMFLIPQAGTVMIPAIQSSKMRLFDQQKAWR